MEAFYSSLASLAWTNSKKEGSIINVGVYLDSSIFFAIKNALISFFLYNKVTTLNRKGEISAKLY